VIPSAEEPFLVLSRKEPSLLSEVVFLENAPTSDAQNVASRSRFLSTEHISCWGSALGLLAMHWNHAKSDEFFFVYCALYAEKKKPLSLPLEATPRGIFLESLTTQRFVLMSLAEGGESLLCVGRDDYPWDLDGALL